MFSFGFVVWFSCQVCFYFSMILLWFWCFCYVCVCVCLHSLALTCWGVAVLNRCLGELLKWALTETSKSVLVNLEDIKLFSPNFSARPQRLESVLQNLQVRHKLFHRLEKFLGYHVNQQLAKRILWNWPEPQDGRLWPSIFRRKVRAFPNLLTGSGSHKRGHADQRDCVTQGIENLFFYDSSKDISNA